jgi:hypothetical protein
MEKDNEIKKLLKEPEKYIPQGCYCYERIQGKFRACPFWDCDETKPDQENGYCHYLEEGDWENDHFGLLWDMVKECGINDDLPEWFTKGE